MSSGGMLTPAEIESLRENMRLGLELIRVASARDDAIARHALGYRAPFVKNFLRGKTDFSCIGKPEPRPRPQLNLESG
jgi:hypothetical protein